MSHVPFSRGLRSGRKDFCHFSQRFLRPSYLQRILKAKDKNHEDVHFSYVAVRKGRDDRVDAGLVQGQVATDAAFAGHEGDLPVLDQDEISPDDDLETGSGFPSSPSPPHSPIDSSSPMDFASESPSQAPSHLSTAQASPSQPSSDPDPNSDIAKEVHLLGLPRSLFPP